MYVLLYVQGSGRFIAVNLETGTNTVAWKKFKAMKATAEKRGKRWSAVRIYFDDGYASSEVFRWDAVDSPFSLRGIV